VYVGCVLRDTRARNTVTHARMRRGDSRGGYARFFSFFPFSPDAIAERGGPQISRCLQPSVKPSRFSRALCALLGATFADPRRPISERVRSRERRGNRGKPADLANERARTGVDARLNPFRSDRFSAEKRNSSRAFGRARSPTPGIPLSVGGDRLWRTRDKAREIAHRLKRRSVSERAPLPRVHTYTCTRAQTRVCCG